MDADRFAKSLMNPRATPSERAIRTYFAQLPRGAHVGARHHIVPRFYLRRFAIKDQVLVRDTTTGITTTRSTGDLAVKDFYTSYHVDGFLDGSIEHLLSHVERAMAQLLNDRLHAFAKPVHFTSEHRAVLDMFVSFQMVRGARNRRIVELIADASAKMMAEGELSPQELEGIEAVPHQNEHLRMIGGLASRLNDELAVRPTCLVTIPEPRLITCDEPVLLVTEGRGGRLIPVQGLENAEGVLMPLDPKTLLFYGQRGTELPPRVAASGSDATELVEDIDELVAANAYRWIIAPPSNRTLERLKVAQPAPLLAVTDGNGRNRIPGLQSTRRSLRSPYQLDPNPSAKADRQETGDANA